jgi:hypothetical protein
MSKQSDPFYCLNNRFKTKGHYRVTGFVGIAAAKMASGVYPQ